MEVFAFLKIIAQVLGVFPFKQKRIFYISKLYLTVNIFVGFFLLLSGVLCVVVILHENWETERSEKSNDSSKYRVDRLTIMIIFGRVIVSLTAVITKFMWRKEHVEILNTIIQFHREHRVNSILNTTTMSDYFFIAALLLPLAVEIISSCHDIKFYDEPDVYLAPVVKFQIILDEIMFCVVCSALSKYQHAIKQMISSLAITEEAQGISSDSTIISETDMDTGDSSQNQLQQINVIERQIKHCYGRSVSMRAKKLEYLRKMNLKIFNIYSDYSALHQYQLFLATTVSILEIIDLIFATIALLTNNLHIDSTDITFQYARIFSHLATNLFRVFMLCYYNDKAFNEGISIKYIVQEIRGTSNDKNFIKVSKIFIDQLHNREQFQICGVFAYNMTLPVMFIGYSISYVVVLMQYLGLKM